MKLPRAWSPALLAGALLPLPAIADDEHAGIAMDHQHSARAELWSGDRQLSAQGNLAQVSLWSQFRLDAGAAGQVLAKGWLRAQTPENAPALRRGALRELYWRQQFGDVQIRAGRQLLVWGRADGVNPTDNLSPKDFRLLTPEDADQRNGSDAVQFIYSTGIGQFSLIAIPALQSHRIPLPAMPGVQWHASEAVQQQAMALKWDYSGEGVDASLSLLRGPDLMPGLAHVSMNAQGLQLHMRPAQATVLGADFSASYGGLIWRAETAYSRYTDSVHADSAALLQPKRHQWMLVAGPEAELGGNTTLGIQVLLQRVSGWRDPQSLADPLQRILAMQQASFQNQTRASQYGLTWRLATRKLNDSLVAEVSGLMLAPERAGLWRAKVDYALNDQWHVQAGAERYFGPRSHFFGQLKDNNLLYLQLRAGF